ncbi:cupin domain-containing protein [Geodermatophilus amargosae]|uniref:cupin domain-containing protein n=1 Tax=Geodermatophilus amargosae TaxID=1296565 RepID=UPI0034DEAF55
MPDPALEDPYRLPEEADRTAPMGGWRIRRMHRTDGGELTSAVLPRDRTTATAWHDGVSEIWYVCAGAGQVWTHDGAAARTVDLRPGRALLLPPGLRHQARSTAVDAVELLLVVLPPGHTGRTHLTEGAWAPSGDAAQEPVLEDPPAGSSSAAVEVRDLPWTMDHAAPDGSEIRLLPTVAAGGLAHCVVHPGQRTRAVRHRTVTELWYVLDGLGELARWDDGVDAVPRVLPLRSGTGIGIPVWTAFQFRCTGVDPLRLLLTMPQWPGPDEADTTVGGLDAWRS